TRMVVNLARSLPYSTRTEGSSFFVVVGDQAGGGSNATNVAGQASSNAGFTSVASTGADITGVDFRRGDNDAGQIIIDLARSNISANISQSGSRLLVEFNNAAVGRENQVRLDVQDFATAVQAVSVYNEDENAIVAA